MELKHLFSTIIFTNDKMMIAKSINMGLLYSFPPQKTDTKNTFCLFCWVPSPILLPTQPPWKFSCCKMNSLRFHDTQSRKGPVEKIRLGWGNSSIRGGLWEILEEVRSTEWRGRERGISRNTATDYMSSSPCFGCIYKELKLLNYFKFNFGWLPISVTESLL